MTLTEARTIHVIGVGGIGVSSIAKWALEQGKVVSGSDLHETPMTQWLQSHGATVHVGAHRTAHVPAGVDVVVYSVAIPEQNPERQEAHRRGVLQLRYPEAVQELLKGKIGVAIAGTHGKSTTTAMLAHILIAAQRDPSVIVGTRVHILGDTNERFGQGQEMVVEADEFNQGILLYRPQYAAVLNVEQEHVDVYPTLQDVQHAFQTFASHIAAGGTLVLRADDPSTPLLREATAATVRTFGFSQADLVATDVAVTEAGTTFQVQGLCAGSVQLSIYGAHNVLNAMAALCLAHALGVPFTVCQQALQDFPGTWRRFERRGMWRQALVIDDYGHHPTELAATIDAARQVFPNQRLVIVFQPHTHVRTRTFTTQFATVLRRADKVLVTDVYDVAGRESGSEADIPALVQDIGAQATYVHSIADAVRELTQVVQANDVVLTIGAGDVTTLYDLLQKENPS